MRSDDDARVGSQGAVAVGPTFVATDVVDSTQLAARLGEHANARLWDAHDEFARSLVATWRGQELERTDGIVVAFSQPEDAVGFAIEYRRAVATLEPPLSVRIGLHRGSDDGTDAYDVVETAGHVADLARGGQILLTRGALPDGPLDTRGLGFWRIHPDLLPIEVFAMSRADGVVALPVENHSHHRVVRSGDRWIAVRELSYALPAERDPFVGRASDLKALGSLVEQEGRLVTVTGIGGTGKTRLVTRFGWSRLGSFEGGVWFCDLSEARTRNGLIYAVAVCLDVPLVGEAPVEQIGHALRSRGRGLVILDNFEQLTEHARETLGVWLAQAPRATFVVTSREVVGLPGEITFDLSPLDEAEAVELFAHRAAAARRTFAVTDANRDVVAELVRRLDHLPLAIELAAARVRVMAPDTLLARLSDRFELLTSRGARVPRQATMRAIMDWSWELLEPDERTALAQLAVFEGGFGLEAAEAVLDLDEIWSVDALQSLVDKSLVARAGEERFGLLMSVQAYATEKLDGSGLRASAEARHGEVYAALGSDDGIAALYQHGGVERRAVLELELGNTVAAFWRARERDDPDVAIPALRAAVLVVERRGPARLARELAEAALCMRLTAGQRATVQTLRARAYWRLGQLDEARGFIEEALAIWRAEGDRREEGRALGLLGTLVHSRGSAGEAERCFDEALAITREVGDRRFEGAFRGLRALVAVARGHVPQARDELTAALAIHREVGNRTEEGVALANLGMLAVREGSTDEALEQLSAALQAQRATGFRLAEAFTWLQMGALRRRLGDLVGAREAAEAALRILRGIGQRSHEGEVLGLLAEISHDEGDIETTFERLSQARVVYQEVGDQRGEVLVLLEIANRQARRGRPVDAQEPLEDAARRVEALDDPWLRSALCRIRAIVDASQGRHERARAHLDAAEAIAEQLGFEPEGEDRRRLDEARQFVDDPGVSD